MSNTCGLVGWLTSKLGDGTVNKTMFQDLKMHFDLTSSTATTHFESLIRAGRNLGNERHNQTPGSG